MLALMGLCPISVNTFNESLVCVICMTIMNTQQELLTHNWEFLQTLFPAGWKALARETRAVLNFKGDVKSLSDLMQIFFIHLAGGYSLKETVVRAEMAGLGGISNVTLMNRLKNAEEWFRKMSLDLIDERDIKPPYVGDMIIKLVDATHFKEPGKTGSEWRLHYSLKMPELRCDHFELTSVKGKGTGENFVRFPVSSDDCIMGDRAYSTIKNVEHVHKHNGKTIVRLNHQTLPLYSMNGDRLDLLELFQGLTEPGQIGGWHVAVHAEDSIINGRLCVIRKDDDAISNAHKKLKRRAQKKQGQIKPETWEFAKYIMVFTTVPEAGWSVGQILELYRFRWQVELAFKRFKSLTQLGHVPKHDDKSVKAWLYGKLFICLLTEKLVTKANFFSPWGLVGIRSA